MQGHHGAPFLEQPGGGTGVSRVRVRKTHHRVGLVPEHRAGMTSGPEVGGLARSPCGLCQGIPRATLPPAGVRGVVGAARTPSRPRHLEIGRAHV